MHYQQRSCARQQLDKTGYLSDDAWDSTNWEGFCGIPPRMVAPELKLTKKATADTEGAGLPFG